MGNILAFTGKLGSGKDYCAMKRVEELNNNGYVMYLISFADPIKQILRDNFGFEKVGKTEDFYPSFTESYVKRMICSDLAGILVDTYIEKDNISFDQWYSIVEQNYDKYSSDFYANVIGANTGYIEYHLAFRKLGQLLGTELGRYVKDSIWIDYALKKIENVFDENLADYAVITDCRFINEFSALLSYSKTSGTNVEIYGIVASNETRAKRRKLSMTDLLEQDKHGSETEIDSIISKLKPEFIIQNEG